MRGQVEIYVNYGFPTQELICQEDNVIVDGAAEHIADLMTYPTPSLSGSSELSSILDASNYTVQAMSFGKAADNFSRHAHIYPSSLSNSSTIIDFETSGIKVVAVPYTDAGVGINTSLSSQDHYGSSAYPGGPYLPSAPEPENRILEEGSIPMAAYTLSSIFSKLGVDWGQNLNMIPYRDSIDLSTLSFSPKSMGTAAVSASHEMNSIITALGTSAVWLGCYPQSSSTGQTVTSGIMLSSWDGITDSTYAVNVITSGNMTSGVVNSASSMDIFGYLGQHYCVDGTIAPVETDPLSGLIISGGPEVDGSAVAFITTLGAGDVQCANLYGGITTMGLWALDICKSLEDSPVLPPLQFDPINNPRKYKLFSKKVFNDNICKIAATSTSFQGDSTTDFTGHKDLTLVWRLFF